MERFNTELVWRCGAAAEEGLPQTLRFFCGSRGPVDGDRRRNPAQDMGDAIIRGLTDNPGGCLVHAKATD